MSNDPGFFRRVAGGANPPSEGGKGMLSRAGFTAIEVADDQPMRKGARVLIFATRPRA